MPPKQQKQPGHYDQFHSCERQQQQALLPFANSSNSIGGGVGFNNNRPPPRSHSQSRRDNSSSSNRSGGDGNGNHKMSSLPPHANKKYGYERRASHHGSGSISSSSPVISSHHRHPPAPPPPKNTYPQRNSTDAVVVTSVTRPPLPYHGSNGSSPPSTTTTSSLRPHPPPPPRRRAHSMSIANSPHSPPSSSPRENDDETPLRNLSANGIGSRVSNAQRDSELHKSLSGSSRSLVDHPHNKGQPPPPSPLSTLPLKRSKSSSTRSSSSVSSRGRMSRRNCHGEHFSTPPVPPMLPTIHSSPSAAAAAPRKNGILSSTNITNSSRSSTFSTSSSRYDASPRRATTTRATTVSSYSSSSRGRTRSRSIGVSRHPSSTEGAPRRNDGILSSSSSSPRDSGDGSVVGRNGAGSNQRSVNQPPSSSPRAEEVDEIPLPVACNSKSSSGSRNSSVSRGAPIADHDRTKSRSQRDSGSGRSRTSSGTLSTNRTTSVVATSFIKELVPAVAVQGEVVDNTTKTSHSTNFLTTSLSRADPPSRGGTTYLPESLSSLSSSSSRGRTRSRSIEPASQRGRTRSCSVGPPSVARSSKQQVQPEVNNTKSHLVMTSRVDSICNQIYNYLDELDAKISHVRQSRSLVKSSSGNDSRGNGGSAGHTSRVCHSESDRLSSVDILKNGLGIYPPYPRLDEDTTRGRRSPSTVVATNIYSPKSSLKRLDSCSSYSLARKSSLNSSTQTHLSRKSDCDAATAKNKYSSENKEVESGKLSSPKQVHPRAANTATAARRGRSFSRSRSITRRYINSELNPSLTKIFKRLPSKEVVTPATTSENTKSSTASVSTRESSEDNCDRSPIVSVMRSFQDSSSPGTNNNKAEGRKGRCRRRASSLSRQAVQALTTLDATTSSFDYSIHSVLSNDNLIIDANNKPSKKRNHQQQLSMLEMEHSKASMVYDVPFDPITGQCHYHPSVCMAVKMTEEEEEDESTSDNNGVVVGHRGRVQQQSKSTTAATVVVAGWKIVRTTCPKCMYNY